MKTSKKIVGLSAAALLVLTACNPSSSDDEETTGGETDTSGEVSTDISEAPEQTLVVWDQEVRGGQNEQMERLNEAFTDKYPNIKIERNSQSFDDLQTTLRLALTGADAPDVVQANNSRSMMGQFVSSGQIQCLDDYVEAYEWDSRFEESILSYSSYSDDAKVFGEGCVYGLPQVGETVGIYYSESKLDELGLEYPETWDELESQLAEIKDAGETPLVLGNIDKWPAGHVFGPIQGQYVEADQISTLGFGNPGASWDTEENIEAATELQTWVEEGYFNDGVNGADYDQVWQDFANGEGVYLIGGSWLAADLGEAMGDDVRFALPPSDGPTTTGGTGLPFAMTSAAKDPDVAAAYIDFITSDEAMQILAETGNVPVNNAADYADEAEGVVADVMTAFDELTTEGNITPYLDWATENMDQVLGDALQNLIAGNSTPEEFVQILEEAYSEATTE
ncbi:ABC transporter substrate-binding protein [Flaviflexus massiliensis]|uniref:ABC transporter substrate-binding protein n=1 Tax=Flaviflexus massiliensis TaxID=1522309 RepID=UPI0006D55D41|nr:extracellular solute-binding protein [Flaviflexus massiliensis]